MTWLMVLATGISNRGNWPSAKRPGETGQQLETLTESIEGTAVKWDSANFESDHLRKGW